ncbi:MAG TPA: hypothetical protein VEU47_08660 [Candidatus Cybelea sp.]|nr:hypothetical protein [Candidatus Cybelea sp.]
MLKLAALCATAFFGMTLVFDHCAASEAVDIPFKIDEPAAARIAAEAVGDAHTTEEFKYSGAHVDYPFYDFDLRPGPPSKASFGYFAVNPWTGDVWALWGCFKVPSPAARKSQAKIRRQFTREELKQYPRISQIKPECIFEN